jgi:hypothetical protein
MSMIQNLPTGPLNHIFAYLPPREIGRAALINRFFHVFLDSEVWKKISHHEPAQNNRPTLIRVSNEVILNSFSAHDWQKYFGIDISTISRAPMPFKLVKGTLYELPKN